MAVKYTGNLLKQGAKNLISSGTRKAFGSTVGGALVKMAGRDAKGRRIRTFAGAATQDFLSRIISPLGFGSAPNILGSSRVSTGSAGLGIRPSSAPQYTKPQLLEKVKLTQPLSKSDLKLVTVNKPFQRRWSAQRTSDQQIQFLRDNLSWVQGQMQATDQNFQKITSNLSSVNDRITSIDRTIVSIVNQYNKFEKEGLQKQRAEENARSGMNELQAAYATAQRNLPGSNTYEEQGKGPNALADLFPNVQDLIDKALKGLLTGAGVAAGAAGTVVAGKAATKAIEKAAQKRAATKAAQEAAKKTTEKVVKKQATKKLGTEVTKKLGGEALKKIAPHALKAIPGIGIGITAVWLTSEIVEALYALSKSGKPDDRTPATRRGIISRIHAQNPELAAELMKQWVEIRKDASSDAEADRKFIQELAPYIAEKFPDFDFTKYGYTKEGKPRPSPFTPKAGTKPPIKTGPMVTGSFDQEMPEGLTPGYKGYKPLDFNRQFERKQVEQQKSQFLQFGKLPTGFEFLPGHEGRLGTPAAVAARGMMPIMGTESGGLYTGPGSGYTRRAPTEPRSMAYVDPSQTSGYSPGPGAPAWSGTSSQPMKLGGPGAKSVGDLGSVSAKYESGGRGVGFVSTGYKDPGGPSYGVHQLSSKDSMPAFLRSKEGQKYAKEFGGLRPGTAAFNKVYKSIAARDPEAFEMDQKKFYTRTHYDPVRAHAEKLGFDVENRGVQEALYSMSIQHGGAKKIVSSAASAAKGTPQEQINALYQHRTQYVANLRDLPGQTKTSVLNRYRREVKDALQYSYIKPEEKQSQQEGLNKESATAFADRSMKQFDERQNVTGGRVIQKQMEKAGIRKRPISNKLDNVLKYAAGKAGVEVEVWSGGQRGINERGPGRRTGSTRHDYGHAADLDLFVRDEDGNRRKLNWHNPADRKYFNEFLKHSSAAGATGIGAGDSYMGAGRLHVGFGKEATWSSLAHQRTPEFIAMRRAIHQGRQERFDLERAIAEGSIDLSGKVTQKEEPLVPEGFKPKPAAPTGPEQFAEMPKPVAEPPKEPPKPSFREAQETGMKKEAAIPPPPKPVAPPKEPPKIEPRPKEVVAPKPVPTPEPAKAPEPTPEPAKAAPTGPEIDQTPPPQATPTQTAPAATGPEYDYSGGSQLKYDPESEQEAPGTGGYGSYGRCFV